MNCSRQMKSHINSSYSNGNIGNMGNMGLDHNLKQQLIKYIYSTVELSNFKYKIIEYESDLPLLSKQKHFVSANFSGSNCLLVFTKMRNKYCSYLIDRKTLSYSQNQVNLDLVKIIPISVRLDNSIYDGSIFDGILIHNNKIKTFVITDIYTFRGKLMITDKIQYKIMNLVAYLKVNFKDDKMNTIDIMVNKLYEIDQIEVLVKEHLPSMKNYNIKGLAFYPEMSGTKLIFMLDNGQREIVPTEKINQIKTSRFPTNNNELQVKQDNTDNDFLEKNKANIRYIAKSDEPIIATFDMKQTKDTDVYKLYLVESIKRDGKDILISKKMGIAFIPTTECSTLCRDAFCKNPSGRVLMKCQFVNDKSKWQPIEYDKVSKFPSNYYDVEAKLQTLEEPCSDDES